MKSVEEHVFVSTAEDVLKRVAGGNYKPPVLVSAFICGLNEICMSAINNNVPQDYRESVARSLRQCADHWEFGKEPEYNTKFSEDN